MITKEVLQEAFAKGLKDAVTNEETANVMTKLLTNVYEKGFFDCFKMFENNCK